MKSGNTFCAAMTAGILAISATNALGDVGNETTEAFGRAGEDHHVSRTIEVQMGEMYFEPARISAAPGETIRLVVTNVGEAVHELNLGTEEIWESHLAEMDRMMDEGMIDFDRIDHAAMRRKGMMHSDPNAVLLEPGEQAEIVWEFPDQATEVGYACNVPGHRESGMLGQIDFVAES